ncbi:MAG: acyl-CoA dehydrogenase family protein [Myxococcaceae bacterium]
MAADEMSSMLQLDDVLSEDERAVRAAVRRFAERDVLPHIGHHFREGHFPREWTTALGELGVLGANLKGYGCAGLGPVAYGLMLQELERADSGLRSFASVQSSLCMFPIHAYGSEAQKQRYLPELAKGRLVACFGLTEPEAGSDPAALQTRAVQDGNTWILNGSKAWITNAAFADVAVVWAKCGDANQASIRGFLVERGTPGFSAREIPGKFSLRASSTGELHLQDVRVKVDAVLPGVTGLRGPLSCLHQARAGIAFAVTGAAIACFEEARDYVAQRRVFGKPLAGYQLTQAKLADMLTAIVQAQLLGLRVLRIKEQGDVSPLWVSMAKRANVASALEVARSARGMLGANGITDGFAAIRHMLNLESVYTYEGTHEVHTLVMGKAITGLDAFS